MGVGTLEEPQCVTPERTQGNRRPMSQVRKTETKTDTTLTLELFGTNKLLIFRPFNGPEVSNEG